MTGWRFLRGVASVTYSKLVLAISQLALVPVMAHAWGLGLYGQWLLLATMPMFLAASDFGFGTSAGNRLIGEVARNQLSEARTTLHTAALVVLGCSGATLAAIVGTAHALPDRLFALDGGLSASQARTVLLVLSLYGLIGLQQVLFSFVLRSIGRFATSMTITATGQLIETLAVAAAVLAGGGPLAAALTLLGVRCLAVLIQIAASLRLAQWLGEARGRVSAERARELLRPALAAMLLPFAQAGYVQGTALAVGAAAGPVAVSIFTTLRTLSRVGLQLLMAINQPLLPDYTAAYARGRIEWLRRTAGALLAAALLAGLGFALGLYFLGDAVIALWTGGAIAVPGLMLSLVALAVPFAALWNTVANLLLATNRHEAFAAVFLVAAGLSTVLTYVLVVNWGVALAPGAMLLLDVAMTVLGIRMLSKSLDCGSNQLIASLGSGAGKYAFGRGREEGAGK